MTNIKSSSPFLIIKYSSFIKLLSVVFIIALL